MKMSTKIMAINTLILSTILVMSSETWFSMWIGLEINMLSFIPLIEKQKNMNSSESKMMYFLIQSMSSITFLFLIIMNPLLIMTTNMTSEIIMIMMSMTMFMKMGMTPFHMWFVNMINKISWSTCMILMTWQKIAPMFILSNLKMNNQMTMIMAIMSAVMGAIGGLNHLLKIMAFSSINHMGWMFICMKYQNEMWMKYLMIYSIMTITMILFMKTNSMNFINQMNMNTKTKTKKIMILIMMLSMGGLPPFIGFLPKWMVIQSLISSNQIFTLLVLMMTSMITLFYYMRIISPIIMEMSSTNKYNTEMQKKNSFIMTNMLINTMLPMSLLMKLM
uniref:NADH-ubiquinone oxidoreductase chain 2 n=1 Tax=Entomovelia sp. YC-2015 TaxID=1661400 RepID=A0A125QUR0_9HEMI|nr:NADH dehydrogenase subunit 2 [Entomovelia sp. YC-2015]